MKIDTRSITLAATLAALCAVTGFLPYVFFLPVMVAATTLSVGMTAFIGLAFGCISLAYCFVMPVSFVATAFIQAPYIAIFPRLAAAVCCILVYKLLMRIARPTKKAARVACVAGCAALGSLFNTAFVVGMIALCMPSLEVGGVVAAVAVPEMLISGAIECVCMAILTPPISLTLEKHVLLRNRARREVSATVTDGAEHSAENNIPNGKQVG